MNEIELTQELVKINSENPPGNEKQVARFIHDYLQDLKLESELVEFEPYRFNVIAEVGRGDGFVLGGHTDTVPIGIRTNWRHDPLGGEIIGNKLYGRGSSDMKGGVASILASVSKIDLSKLKRKLILLFVADEEANSKGSTWIVKNRKELLTGIKYGMMAEPTYNTIRTAQKGTFRTRVKFKGKSAHGSRPWLGDNAITKATKFIDELERLAKKLEKKEDPLLGYGTINIGKISGGIKVNVVPNYCEVEIDRRLVRGETPSKAMKQYKDILKELGIKAEIELMGDPRLPMEIPNNSKLVKMIKSVIDSEIIGGAGYTESELYYRECGIEFISFGPGNPKQAHVDDEFIEIPKLKEATRVFENMIRKLCC